MSLQPPIQPAMETGLVGRIDQRYAAAGVQPGQRRTQQVDFAYAGLAGHEFDQGPQRPAAGGQFLIQDGKACGRRRLAGARQLRTAPEGGVYGFGLPDGRGTHSIIMIK